MCCHSGRSLKNDGELGEAGREVEVIQALDSCADPQVCLLAIIYLFPLLLVARGQGSN